MRPVLVAAALLLVLPSLAGCNAKKTTDPIFRGELIALNGEATGGSMLHVRLTSTDDDPSTAERYFIYSVGCIDAGFLDKADGKFWSGTSPAKNGELGEYLRDMRVEGHCPPEDATRYVALMELMRRGVSLQLDPDGRFATFTNPSGGSARFEVYLGNIVD